MLGPVVAALPFLALLVWLILEKGFSLALLVQRGEARIYVPVQIG